MSQTSTYPREQNLAELHSLIARDLAASNELVTRITQLRQDIAEGKLQPSKKVDLLERSNKDMTKELVLRVECIESIPAANLEATDREMLQALNARLAVCDLQAMRLAELRDLEFTARGTKERAFLEAKVNEGNVAADREVEEEVVVGHSSRHVVDEVDCDREEPEQHIDALHESFDNSEEEPSSENFDEPVVDKSAWPLLYRILSVDPSTMASDIQPLVNGQENHTHFLPDHYYICTNISADRAYKRLALKHSPQYFPNDPTAPALWEKITIAYNVLIDPDKRMFYDVHEKVPPILEGFDAALLDRE